MRRAVNVLDFDGVYQTQDFYRGLQVHWVHLADLPNVSRYCDPANFSLISARLAGARYHTTFIGSGNYHYVTLVFLQRIQVPFTLILFDNHTDMLSPASHDLITCGSWVALALATLPRLQRVIIVGASDNLPEDLPSALRRRVMVFSRRQLKEQRWLEYKICRAVPTQTVYISVDKDVLSRTEAVTNWDQGDMRLAELLTILRHLHETKAVWGMDVCGEYEAGPLAMFRPETRIWAQKNSRANRALLCTGAKRGRHAS